MKFACVLIVCISVLLTRVDSFIKKNFHFWSAMHPLNFASLYLESTSLPKKKIKKKWNNCSYCSACSLKLYRPKENCYLFHLKCCNQRKSIQLQKGIISDRFFSHFCCLLFSVQMIIFDSFIQRKIGTVPMRCISLSFLLCFRLLIAFQLFSLLMICFRTLLCTFLLKKKRKRKFWLEVEEIRKKTGEASERISRAIICEVKWRKEQNDSWT